MGTTRRSEMTIALAAFASAGACGAFAVGCEDESRRASSDAGVVAVTVSSTTRATAPSDGSAGRGGGASREGCARAGSIEAIASDPSCVIERVPDDATGDVTSRLSLSLVAEPPETTAGATSLLRFSLTNVSKEETLVVLEAIPASAAPRADYKRIWGMPEVRGIPDGGGGWLVPITVTTLDSRERAVDATPIVPGTATIAPRLLGVRLGPGAKLTHVQSWWALRIPAPYPPFKDDAGHLITPKTLPIPLERGDYLVRVEIPLHGLVPAERSATTRVHVDPAPKSPVPKKRAH